MSNDDPQLILSELQSIQREVCDVTERAMHLSREAARRADDLRHVLRETPERPRGTVLPDEAADGLLKAALKSNDYVLAVTVCRSLDEAGFVPAETALESLRKRLSNRTLEEWASWKFTRLRDLWSLLDEPEWLVTPLAVQGIRDECDVPDDFDADVEVDWEEVPSELRKKAIEFAADGAGYELMMGSEDVAVGRLLAALSDIMPVEFPDEAARWLWFGNTLMDETRASSLSVPLVAEAIDRWSWPATAEGRRRVARMLGGKRLADLVTCEDSFAESVRALRARVRDERAAGEPTAGDQS